MSIHVVCQDCGAEYDLKDEHAGKKMRCKACQAVVLIKEADKVLVEARSLSASDRNATDFPIRSMGNTSFQDDTRAKGVQELSQIPIQECISVEERKKRPGVLLVNLLFWGLLGLLVVTTMGGILLIYGISWLVSHILAEYNVRKLQALGTEATTDQFPEITQALAEACEVLGIRDHTKVIIVNDSHLNAFAIKFARKKVIVLLSETLEGIIDRPEELRFFLGHELAHGVLDHGKRGMFELYKPAAYKAAREMTCDNAGTAAAGAVEAAQVALKRLAVGHHLYPRLNDASLAAESQYIYSGLTGWLLKQYLTYPPIGKRLANVEDFGRRVLSSEVAHT